MVLGRGWLTFLDESSHLLHCVGPALQWMSLVGIYMRNKDPLTRCPLPWAYMHTHIPLFGLLFLYLPLLFWPVYLFLPRGSCAIYLRLLLSLHRVNDHVNYSGVLLVLLKPRSPGSYQYTLDSAVFLASNSLFFLKQELDFSR